MMTKIFRNYDQVSLDAEYDNRSKIPNALELLKDFAELSEVTRRNLEGRLGVSFGLDAEETLDIFFPPNAGDNLMPIQLFIHGGYWTTMSKSDFSYVAETFTQKGCVTVVINYGLIPSVDMDEVVRQCRAGLVWIYRNGESFGGNPDRIFISGHSAGGHLVAMMMATNWPDFDSLSPTLPKDLIKGGCGISGLYDLEPIRLCFLNEDLRLGKMEVNRNSPVLLGPAGSAPLLLTVGSLEGPEYLRQSEELAAAWRPHGVEVDVVVQEGQDHFTMVLQLSEANSRLSTMILKQMGCAD